MALVTLPYDYNLEALEWAKENCPSYITNASNPSISSTDKYSWPAPHIDYFFSDEKDATWFRLRWAQ